MKNHLSLVTFLNACCASLRDHGEVYFGIEYTVDINKSLHDSTECLVSLNIIFLCIF